jgi:signal transduction histidine kinase
MFTRRTQVASVGVNFAVRASREVGVDVLATVGVLAVLALIDLGTFNLHTPTGQALVGSGVVVGLLCRQVIRLTAAARPAPAVVLTLVAVAVSTGVTSFVEYAVHQRVCGFVELAALLLVLRAFARRTSLSWLSVGALPVVIAIGLLQLRLAPDMELPLFSDVDVWFVLLPAIFFVWGFHLRSQDLRHASDVERVRRSERLELARDLHDNVAHYVTVMIVQAQAGEAVVDHPQGRQLFGNIERTGQDGLVAMGRMVGLLREGEQQELPAVLDIDIIRGQVDRFASEETAATLVLGPGVEAVTWSPQLAKSVERLVLEGLTNVRKHARSATAVQVAVELDGDRLVVRVSDDGAKPARPRFRSSGFGMIGLRERVSALGGALVCGPVDGGGWQLCASIPIQ